MSRYHLEALHPRVALYPVEKELFDGRGYPSGVVQVEPFRGGGLRPVCADEHWTSEVAEAVCRELGYAGGALGHARVHRLQTQDSELKAPYPVRLRCPGSDQILGRFSAGSNASATLSTCGVLAWDQRDCEQFAIAVCTGMAH